MTLRMLRIGTALAIALIAPSAHGRPQRTGWDEMKSLVGAWQGTADGHPVSVSYALVSGGTALMETLDSSHEGHGVSMVTLYAPDGASILATHYCAAGNQPRMRAAGSPDGGSLAYEFVDVSNSSGSSEVMRRLVVQFVDPDHFRQIWTSRAPDGKEHSAVFEYTRKR